MPERDSGGQPTAEEQLRALYENAESTAARAFEQAVATPSFGALLARSAENVAAISRIGSDLADLVLRNLRLASRADITRMARQLHRTEDKLERVLQEIERLRDELAAARTADARERESHRGGRASDLDERPGGPRGSASDPDERPSRPASGRATAGNRGRATAGNGRAAGAGSTSGSAPRGGAAGGSGTRGGSTRARSRTT